MAGPRYEVTSSEDAGAVLRTAGSFLASRPVHHNVVVSTLADLVDYPGVGRFWCASDRAGVAGVAIQVPKGGRAELSLGRSGAIDALVDAMADDVPDLPGVIGEAGVASRFAGRWAERQRVPARPVEGGRLYRLGALVPPARVPGTPRPATVADADLVAEWAAGFAGGTGDHAGTVANARNRLAAGRVWLWEDGEPGAMASAPPPAHGVARVGLVYTPPDRRRRGYAAAVTAALSRQLLDVEADTCILYTQLHNPTSNAVYQRLGYKAVGEVLIYAFDRPAQP